jgi:hypothetical protein
MAQLKIDVIVDDNNAAQKLAGIERGVKGVEDAASKSAVVATNAAKTHSSAFGAMATSASNFLKTAGAVYGGLLLDKGISALVSFGREAFRTADQLTNLSAKSGLSITMLQKLEFIGMQAGVSMQSFADAAYMVGVRLGQGSKGVVGAVNDLGLNFAALKAMNPTQQMDTILTALSKVENKQAQNLAGHELFGRSWKQISAAIGADYVAMGNAASTASDKQIQALDRASDAWDRFVENRKKDMTSLFGSLVLAAQNNGVMGFLNNLGARMSGLGASSILTEFGDGDGLTPAQREQDRKFAAKFAEQQAAALRGEDPATATSGGGPRAKTPAEIAAEERAKRLDDLSGRTAVAVAQQWLQDVKDIGGATALATDKQEAYNKALGEGLDAMMRMGRVMDNDMIQAWARGLMPGAVNGLPSGGVGTQVGIPTITDLPGLFTMPSAISGLSQLPGQQMARPTPPNVSLIKQIMGSAEEFGYAMSQSFTDAILRSRSLSEFFKGLGQNVAYTLGNGLGKVMDVVADKIGGLMGGLMKDIPFGELAGKLFGKLYDKIFGPTEYELRTREETAQRNEIASSMDMGALQNAADFTGRQDLLSGITSGLATNNDPEYIRSLLADLQGKTDQLQAAMDRYGISWEQLGEKAKQSQINQMAEQFVLDFQLLTHAGADVNFVVEKMGTSINEFLNTAIRTGTEVPIAMQPLVTRMAELGTLGVDLEQITWAESMTMGFNKVAEAINHLAQALGFELPKAAQAGADGMNAAFAGVKVPGFSGGYAPEAPEDYIQENVPQMARGGYVPARPGGTLINVGEGGQGEYVVPASKMGGGGGNITIVLERDGQREAEYIVPFIPGAVERLGL